MTTARAIRRMVAAGSAVMIAAVPRAARAQSATLVSVTAGTTADERGVSANSVTMSPMAVLAPDPKVAISLGASATRFETAAWMVGGSVTVAARTGRIAGTALSLNAGGGVSRSSFGTTFTVADATPAVEWTVATITLFGGARVALGRTTVRTTANPPTPIPAPGGTTVVSATRSSRGPVFGVQWNVLGDAAHWPVTATYREERGTTDDIMAIDRTAGLSVRLGALAFGGSAGERVAPSDHARFAGGSASLALTPTVSINLAAGRYPVDRLTGAMAGRFMAAGLSMQFGAGGPQLPAPRGVRPAADGMTRLSIRAEDAREVEVYGDWNDWTPIAAHRADNGVWYVDVPLSPGEYRYAFHINQVEWRVPEGAVTAKDGFGGRSAYVTVARDAPQQGRDSREER